MVAWETEKRFDRPAATARVDSPVNERAVFSLLARLSRTSPAPLTRSGYLDMVCLARFTNVITVRLSFTEEPNCVNPNSGGKIPATHFRLGQIGSLGCQLGLLITSPSRLRCLRSLVFPNLACLASAFFLPDQCFLILRSCVGLTNPDLRPRFARGVSPRLSRSRLTGG